MGRGVVLVPPVDAGAEPTAGSASPQAAEDLALARGTVMAPGTAPQVLQYLTPAPQAPPIVPPVWASWVAILATSALFALVHPTWTWPAIFLLAVCLGYAYERTGNLWVPVVIHAAFNATSTVLFLYGGGAN
jgi:hypothetical protein